MTESFRRADESTQDPASHEDVDVERRATPGFMESPTPLGHGLGYWQRKYADRLANPTQTITVEDDWWFEDGEVMVRYQEVLAERLRDLESQLAAKDDGPAPFSNPVLERFQSEGVIQIGNILSLDSVRQLPIGSYETDLVSADLQNMANALKTYGTNPFAASRPLISLAEMNSNPFQFPVEYFLQAYSGEDQRLEWPAEVYQEANRIWREFATERAVTQREYLVRSAAIGDAARQLQLIVPHPAHYDRLLPGTSELQAELEDYGTEYLRLLRNLVKDRQ